MTDTPDYGYEVDQQKVRNLFMPEAEDISIKDLTRVACSFGASRDSVDVPIIAAPAKFALDGALAFIQDCAELIQGLYKKTTDDVGDAMRRVEGADTASDSNLGEVMAKLGIPAGANPYEHLQSQGNQVQANLAEIGVRPNFDPSQVHLRPGDVLTTTDGRLFVTGQDGRFYQNNVAVAAPTGSVLILRPMTAAPLLGAGGEVA
jgi:hypothetical protein